MSSQWSSRRSTTSTGSSSHGGSSSSRRNNSIIQNSPPYNYSHPQRSYHLPSSSTIIPFNPQNHYHYHYYYYSNPNGYTNYVNPFQYHHPYNANQQQQPQRQQQLDWDPDRVSDRDPDWGRRQPCPYHTNPPPDPHVDHHQTTRTTRNNANDHRHTLQIIEIDLHDHHDHQTDRNIRNIADTLQLLEIDEDNTDHHQTARTRRNNVNIHKHTLRLEIDQHNPDHHLLSFVFDAVHDGSITIFYFAEETKKCRFVPQFPDAFEPLKVPFKKGVGQKFAQQSGTGIDLGFFELDDLSKPSPGEDVFPLVICAETCPHMQITQAVLEKSNSDGTFQIKVVKQILWIDGVRSELREPYGIGSSTSAGFDYSDPGKDCVICMTNPKDTITFPCEHMCMCSECAKALQLKSKSNKCPICRQPIEGLIEIKVKNDACFSRNG